MVATISMSLPEGFRVDVQTTTNRGFTPEEVAKRCAAKIIGVADSAPSEIRDQARAFRLEIEAVLTHYMKEAVASDRTTVYNMLKNAGHSDVAEIIRGL